MRTRLVVGPLLALLVAIPVCHARGRAAATRLMATESSQAIQNERANAFHLSRLSNLAQVREFSAEGLLVSVPSRTSYYYLEDVPADYSYLRPWAKLFLDRLSRDYYTRFGQPLRVTSLLRTVELQRQLTRWNPNAAQAVGADRSTHLTGATLDISKHDMNWSGMQWLRLQLLQMKREGYLYAVEEFHQPCFHVMVFPTYRGDIAAPVQHAAAAPVQRAAAPAIPRASVRRASIRQASYHRRRRIRRRAHRRRHRTRSAARRHTARPAPAPVERGTPTPAPAAAPAPNAPAAAPAHPVPAVSQPVPTAAAPAAAPALQRTPTPAETEPVTVKTLGDLQSSL